MICDIEISKLKPDSVLFRDEKGKFICMTKEEFLKEFKNEIADFSNEINNLKNYTEETRKLITGEILRQNERIDKLSQSLLDFIKIMKGEPANEEINEENNE